MRVGSTGNLAHAAIQRTVDAWEGDDGFCTVTLEFSAATPYLVELVITEDESGAQWRHGASRPSMAAALTLTPTPEAACPPQEAVELHVYPAAGARLVFVSRPHRADRSTTTVLADDVAAVLSESYQVAPPTADEHATWLSTQPRYPWSRHAPGCDNACPGGGRNQPPAIG